MNIRRRGSRATLWRSEWVPKGREENSHGFKREKFVAFPATRASCRTAYGTYSHRLSLLSSTLVEWDDNIAISDAPPSQYWPKYAERFDPETLAAMMRWHALPQDWWALSYEDFLVARRPLIADVIRQGYVKLCGGE